MNRRSAICAAAAATAIIGLPLAAMAAPSHGSSTRTHGHHRHHRCLPDARATGYSDALDKLTRGGAVLGGLSSIAHDRRSHAYASAVDNNGTDPARIWFYRNLAHPHITRAPLVLKRPDGTPYDGTDSDNEGLAVLPGGDYLVSSETEPSIRIYGRDGVQRTQLPVPARFAVTGTTKRGQATANATLEGLTISPDGREVVAAMEGALSGDVSATADTTYHRLLVYRRDAAGRWALEKQVGYRAEVGMRIPEVAAISADRLLVEEAAFSPVTGNAVSLFAVDGLRTAPDVSSVANLSAAPSADVLSKTLVANLQTCPTLGAPAKETQTNPLLDNIEGMTITSNRRHNRYGVSLISDDNFSAAQTTRILDLVVKVRPNGAAVS